MLGRLFRSWRFCLRRQRWVLDARSKYRLRKAVRVLRSPDFSHAGLSVVFSGAPGDFWNKRSHSLWTNSRRCFRRFLRLGDLGDRSASLWRKIRIDCSSHRRHLSRIRSYQPHDFIGNALFRFSAGADILLGSRFYFFPLARRSLDGAVWRFGDIGQTRLDSVYPRRAGSSRVVSSLDERDFQKAVFARRYVDCSYVSRPAALGVSKRADFRALDFHDASRRSVADGRFEPGR